MKRLCLIALVMVLAGAFAPAGAQSPQQLFQQALSKERADGNLEEAIRLYEGVLAEAGADRALASRALLQIGRCYEKLGEARARESYERLVRDFPEQAAAGEARTRLATLARSAPAAPAAPAALTVRPLPDIAGDIQALSPDGARAVIVEYLRGGQNLSIHDLRTGRAQPITHFNWTDYWVWGAAWSPDGNRIVFARTGFKADAVAELQVASLDGETRTIFRNQAAPGARVWPAAWLPDGRAVLAMVERPDRSLAMGLVTVADGSFTPIKTFAWGDRDSPALSPDGRRIAFVDRSAGAADVHVVSVDGREAHRVTDHPAEDRGPVWSPDGRHLAFLSNRFGAQALWAVAMEGARPRGEPFRIRDGMLGVNLLDWSARGIGAIQLLRSWDVYTVDVDAKTLRPAGPPKPIPFSRTGRNVSPAWSPDGKALAFISSAASDASSRYVVVLPRSGQPREFLIPTNQYDFPQAPYDLRWFGNGQGLGFSGVDAKGEQVAFRLTLDTGEWQTFPIPAQGWTRIAWNHDGSAFYYARQSFAGPGGGVYERRLDGTERRLHPAPAGSGSSRRHEVSPDGRWLAFQEGTIADGTETNAIVVVNLESAQSRALASHTNEVVGDGGHVVLSGWSPDNRVLVQRRANREAPAEWLLAPVDGGAPQRVTIDLGPQPEGEGNQGAPLVHWSPDGSTLAFVRTRTEHRAFVIENPLAGSAAATTSAGSR